MNRRRFLGMFFGALAALPIVGKIKKRPPRMETWLSVDVGRNGEWNSIRCRYDNNTGITYVDEMDKLGKIAGRHYDRVIVDDPFRP